MKSFNCLDPLEVIAKPYFLEASAGTGKTFAIEHIFVRLLLEKEIKCKNILVVTFTNAATRELKARIYSSLEQAYKQLQNNNCILPYLKEIPQESRNEALYLLEKAKLEFEDAQIFTIHGFCLYCLKTHGLDAKILFDHLEIEKKEDGNGLKEVVLDTFRADLDENFLGISQLKQLLKKNRGDLEKVVNKIASLLEKQIELKESKSFSELTDAFVKTLEKLKRQIDVTAFENCFEKVAFCYKGLANRQGQIHSAFYKQQKLLLECLTKEPSREHFEKLLLDDELYLENITDENRKKKEAVLEEEKIFHKARELLLPLWKEVKDTNLILLNLASLCAKRVKKRKETPFSFDEYLRLMLQSLSKESFKKKVQSLYKAAIVDEFQDTDPIQWKIFKTLFVNERKDFPLFLVGDPKQSIYAFRNADLPTYVEAASFFSQENRFSLDTNYRSEPSLVRTLNVLFSKENARNWLSKEEKIQYLEVKAGSFAQDTVFEDGGKSVHLAVVEEKKSKEKLFPTKQTEEEKIFPYIAREICNLREKQKVFFKDIAILVKDRYQMQRLKQAFLKWQIPVQAKSMTLLSETKAYDFLYLLFSSLSDDADKGAFRSILIHPFMGICFEDVLLSGPTTKGIHALLQLQNLKKIYLEKGFLTFWESFLQTKFLEKETFEQNLLAQEKKEDYFDLIQIVELLFGEVVSPYYIEDILFFMDRLNSSSKDDPEKMQRGLQKEDAVCLMTTHISKGLEFPYVFALGIATRFSSEEEIIRQEEGFEVFDEKNPKHEKIVQNLNEEKMRQLYVALTRAKKRVYGFFCFGEEETSETKRSPMELFANFFAGSFSKEALLAKLSSLENVNLQIDLLEHLDLVKSLEKEEKRVHLPKPRVFSRKFQEKTFSSYSSLARHKIETIQEEPKEKPLLPSSKETGNILHAILEKVFERGLYKGEQSSSIKALVERETQGTFYKIHKELLFELVELACHIKLQTKSEEFALSEVDPSDLNTELPFYLYLTKEETIKGFIDICFIKNNKLYLLDWKSNFLSSYEEEKLSFCMEKESYFLQADLYSKAIKAYLNKSKSPYSYGGMFYVFLRGLKKGTSEGVYYVNT